MELAVQIEFTDAARAAAKDIETNLAPAFGAITPMTGDIVQLPGQPLLFVVAARLWHAKDKENVALHVMLDLHDQQPLAAV